MQTEESYILREYYKGFLPNQVELIKIKEKINKINREKLLSFVIEQDKQIYNIISDNYKSTYELIDTISTNINNLNNQINKLQSTPTPSIPKIHLELNPEFPSSSSDSPSSLTTIDYFLSENLSLLNSSQEQLLLSKEKLNQSIHKCNDINKQLNEWLESKETIINKIKENIEIETIISNVNFEILNLFFRHFLLMNDNELKYCDYDNNISLEDKKFMAVQTLNKKNKQELKQKLLHCDSKLKDILTKKQLLYIKNKLDLIDKSISQQNNETEEHNFFYCLYKGLFCVFNIIFFQKEINENKEVINKEEMKINELQKEIDNLHMKIHFYENIKTKIENKYEINRQINKKQNELKFHTISSFPTVKTKSNSSNNIVKETTEETPKITRKKSSKLINSPHTIHLLPNIHPPSAKNDLNEIKLLINKMETNYIHLLKNLSKTIIKPKNLINKPDISFLQSKIK